MTDIESRYKALIQPIKDLAQNWDVDIVEELGEYLEQLCNLDIQTQTNGLNFAEAALLVQGSAAIYGRKVEYLHQLVFKALELISTQKFDKSGNPVATSARQSTATSFLDDERILFGGDDTYLLLDDLIEEGTNITIDSAKEKQAIQEKRRSSAGRLSLSADTSRASMILMHSILQEDHGGSNLKLSSCRMDNNGTLLMSGLFNNTTQPPSNGFENMSMISNGPRECNNSMYAYDDGMMIEQENSQPMWNDNDDDDHDYEMPTEPTACQQTATKPILPVFNNFGSTFGPRVTFNDQITTHAAPNPVVQPVEVPDDKPNPLALLDSHETASGKPISKGKTFKIPVNLPPLGGRADLRGTKRSQKNANARPTLSAFHAIAKGKIPANGLSNPQFRFIVEKERKIIQAQKLLDRLEKHRNPQIPAALNAVRDLQDCAERDHNVWNNDLDDDDNDHEAPYSYFGDFEENQYTQNDPIYPNVVDDIGTEREPITDAPQEVETEEEWLARRVEQALSEDLVLSQNVTYESLCRKHIDNFMSGAERYARETQLSKRVSEWTKRLEPYLRAQEEAEPFDIHSYSTNLLHAVEQVSIAPIEQRTNKVPELQAFLHSESNTNVFFNEIATGKENTEVCRMFLACLQLANMGNVTILQNSMEDIKNPSFSLKLNKITSRIEEIENYRAPSSAYL